MELYVVFLPADVEDLDFSVKRESEFAADSRCFRTARAPKPAQAKSKVPYFKDSGRKNEDFCCCSPEEEEESIWTLLPRRDESVVSLTKSEGQFAGSTAQTESQEPQV